MLDLTKRKTILIFLLVFIIAYLILTNFIETNKIYPEEREWFDLNIYAHSDNDSCIDLGEVGISYFNDPKKIHHKGGWETKNLVLLNLHLHERCDFGKLKISMSAKDLKFPIYPVDHNNSFEIDIINKSKFNLLIEYSEGEPYFHWIELVLPIDNDFFNYYRFTSTKIPINVLSFSYRDGLFNNGYTASENSFSILEQKTYYERPVRKDNYKWYDFNSEQSVLLNFTPKSKVWSLIQKMLDAIILGLIVVMVYELLKYSKSKTKKKNGKSKNKH